MTTKKRKKKLKPTWVTARISKKELKEIEKIVKDGKYSSLSEVLRTGVRIGLAIENDNIEWILEPQKKTRIDILIESGKLRKIADVLSLTMER